MSIDEVRMELRRQLEELIGVRGADYLLDRPPGGWNDLATRADLIALEGRIDRRFEEVDRRFEEVDRRFDQIDRRFEEVDRRFDQIDARFLESDGRTDLRLDSLESRILSRIDDRFREQTWRLVAAMTALVGIVVAAIKI